MPSDTIKVKVVFFASAKAAAGVDEWQAELPEGAKVTDVAKAIGAKWKALDDAAKAPWTAKAEADKARYAAAKAAYDASDGAATFEATRAAAKSALASFEA